MSFEDTRCPCGGRKPTDTMLCDDCDAEFADHRAMAAFLDTSASTEYRRHSAVTLVTLARGRGRNCQSKTAMPE